MSGKGRRTSKKKHEFQASFFSSLLLGLTTCMRDRYLLEEEKEREGLSSEKHEESSRSDTRVVGSRNCPFDENGLAVRSSVYRRYIYLPTVEVAIASGLFCGRCPTIHREEKREGGKRCRVDRITRVVDRCAASQK